MDEDYYAADDNFEYHNYLEAALVEAIPQLVQPGAMSAVPSLFEPTEDVHDDPLVPL